MNPPQPKAEMITHIRGDSITIWCASEDSRRHIEANARRFGNLLPLTDGSFILYVSPLYDVAEVALWLGSGEGINV